MRSGGVFRACLTAGHDAQHSQLHVRHLRGLQLDGHQPGWKVIENKHSNQARGMTYLQGVCSYRRADLDRRFNVGRVLVHNTPLPGVLLHGLPQHRRRRLVHAVALEPQHRQPRVLVQAGAHGLHGHHTKVVVAQVERREAPGCSGAS